MTRVDFNPFLPDVLQDPYPAFRQLRDEEPVHWSDKLRSWVLTDYGDIRDVFFRDPRLSSDRTKAAKYRGPRHTSRGVGSDPPEGTIVRGILTQALSPRTAIVMGPRIDEMVEELLKEIEESVERYVEQLAERGSIDLIRDFAYPLPIRVIGELFGVPVEERDQFEGWSRDLAVSMDRMYSRVSPSDTSRELSAYIRSLVEERRRDPGGDLLSQLAAGNVDGDYLTDDELVALGTSLVFAGHETTVNLIGNGMLALIRHPDQLEMVRADDAVTKTAIEELLRFDSPAQLISRSALDDVPLRDKVIRAGDAVVALLGAANRDPSAFDDPDTLDVTRHPNPHLAFGYGVHFCFGAGLSRREAQTAIPALLRRFPKLRLADAAVPRFRSTLVLRGLEEFPVDLD